MPIHPSIFSPGSGLPFQVLTRREQLGLAADMKAEKEEQKVKGKGKGRAGGRGRGRGRGKVGVDPSKVAEPETTPEKPKPSKRAPVPVDTPERRELFPEPPAPVASSPAVKQPKKRIRGKGKAKVAMPEETAESHEPVPDPVDEKAAPKQKAKSRAKPKAKPSAADPADPADASTTKERKIGKATQKTALDLLKGMKGSDEAGWYHAKELYKALKYHKLSDRREVPKWDFWSLSMYWGTGRVGVLQKHHQKGFTHIISFGGVHVKNIAMSAHAARMFVTWQLTWENWSNLTTYTFYQLHTCWTPTFLKIYCCFFETTYTSCLSHMYMQIRFRVWGYGLFTFKIVKGFNHVENGLWKRNLLLFSLSICVYI